MHEPSDESRYTEALAKYGESPKALRWQDYQSAAIRFQHLLTGLSIHGKTILDVGCGMGDLLPYLHAQTADFSYLGVDINQHFIDIASKRYTGHTFEVMDPFADRPSMVYDIIILSGALNAYEDNWLEARKRKISRLYKLANEAVAFNMAGGFADTTMAKGIAYANAQDIIQFCANLTPKLVVQTHYRPKDFTVTLFK